MHSHTHTHTRTHTHTHTDTHTVHTHTHTAHTHTHTHTHPYHALYNTRVFIYISCHLQDKISLKDKSKSNSGHMVSKLPARLTYLTFELGYERQVT